MYVFAYRERCIKYISRSDLGQELCRSRHRGGSYGGVVHYCESFDLITVATIVYFDLQFRLKNNRFTHKFITLIMVSVYSGHCLMHQMLLIELQDVGL